MTPERLDDILRGARMCSRRGTGCKFCPYPSCWTPEWVETDVFATLAHEPDCPVTLALALTAERARVAELEADFEEYRQVTRQADAAARKAEEQRNAERARAEAAERALRLHQQYRETQSKIWPTDTDCEDRHKAFAEASALYVRAWQETDAILQAADQRGGEVGE